MAHPHEILRAVVRGESVTGAELSFDVVESALEHRLAPLLLDSVVTPSEIPTAEAATLVAFDLAVATQRRQQDKIMEWVHERLDDADLPHTFVKGATAAIRWFDVPTHRPYSDIDVVVPLGESFRLALRALDNSHPALANFNTSATQHVSSIETVVGGVRIDMQTDALRTGLLPNSYSSWSVGTDELEFGGGTRLRVLDPEHDLVMFLLHQGRDRFRYLLGVAEASRRLQQPIDWARIEVISRDEGIWEQVAIALEVMCQELQIPVPAKAPSGWRTILWRKLWRPKVRLLGEIGRIRHIRRAAWMMPITMSGRLVEALAWLARSALPPDQVLRLQYPEARGPYIWRAVYYRLRLFARRRTWVWRDSRR